MLVRTAGSGRLLLLLLLSQTSLHPIHVHASSPPPPQKTNLLYIMYDDLRPELSIYGNPHMITPNFERLAKRSVTFDYAFCQVWLLVVGGHILDFSFDHPSLLCSALISVSVSLSSSPDSDRGL
jgi:hypothetical protein